MNIEYIGRYPTEKGKVHKDRNNGYTLCNKLYEDNKEDWQRTSKAITCKVCKAIMS